jgi:hypothetical protein
MDRSRRVMREERAGRGRLIYLYRIVADESGEVKSGNGEAVQEGRLMWAAG